MTGSQSTSTALRRRSAILLLAVAAGVLAPEVAAHAATHASQPATTRALRDEPSSGVRGVPYGAPKAALQKEPRLPEPSHGAWPFPNRFPRTSGTGRLGGGATFWSDFLYDDHGAAAPTGFPLSTSSMTSSLAPTQGIAGYPAGKAHSNGADIFRTAVGLTKHASYWRVDWNTLASADVPIVEWTFDRDDKTATGDSAWPDGAGLTSQGFGEALVVSAKSARLIDTSTHRATNVATHGGTLTVDRRSRSFIVRIPRTLLHVHGKWRVRVAAGLATSNGKAFAEPDYGSGTGLSAGTLAALPHVFNVGYRSVKQEPPVYTNGPQTEEQEEAFAKVAASSPASVVGLDGLSRFVTGNFWMEDDQADALASGGKVSKFSRVVTWSQLAHHRTTAEPHPTGYSNRWYVSRLHLGQGVVQNASNQPSGDLRPNYLGRVQPYAVYVPTGTNFNRPQKLTWVLHSLGVNLNQYGALDPKLLQELCQDRHSICASTEGFGPDGWYFDEAEQDFWSVWHALATSYRLDTEHTVISGYSMGGWASFKLALAHPDLFSQSMPLEGPPVCGIRVLYLLNGQTIKAPADSGQPGRCSADGDSVPLLGNARWLPYDLTQGGTEELVPAPSNLQTASLLSKLGERYTLFFLPEEDHLVYATQDRFAGVVKALGTTPARVLNPPTIDYSWFPNLSRPKFGIGTTTAYWLSGLRSTTSKGGAVATIVAHDRALRDPKITDVRTGPTPVKTPLPALRSKLAWKRGAAPKRADRMTLTLTKVSALTVDTRRADLRCPAITTSSTSAVRLTLTHLRPGSALRVGGRTYRADRRGRVLLRLPRGRSAVHCTNG